MKPNLKDSLHGSITRLTNWIECNGYKGYDPYDAKGFGLLTSLTERGNRNRVIALIRESLFEILYMFPVSSRKFLGISPAFNAKAMGLFATSYLDLYLTTKDLPYLQKAEECLNWLRLNAIQAGGGLGWGYPFNWQSKEFIPAYTPNGIVTTAAGEAFWNEYKTTGRLESLAYCGQIARFLLSLPIDRLNSEQLCFSYTPLFINHVHNLNLFVSEFLIKTGKELNQPEWVEKGNLALQYTLANQQPDGSFDYNGPPEKPNRHIDNYHTGFVLRMLFSIWKLTGRTDVFESLKRGHAFYINNFFVDKQIPKLTPSRMYRIDIHSCAESILCHSVLAESFPESREYATRVFNWTIKHLQDPTGYFYFGILKSRFTGITFISKIPYIRWGQAWMLRALSRFLILHSD